MSSVLLNKIFHVRQQAYMNILHSNTVQTNTFLFLFKSLPINIKKTLACQDFNSPMSENSAYLLGISSTSVQ